MSLGQRLIKNPMEAGSFKNSTKNPDIHDHLDNYEDTIRRLKLLSKSQTALLKAYLYGKLMEGEKLVNKTIEYINVKHSSTSDVKLDELRDALQQLKLKEIEVDVRSTQVLLHDELAQLRVAAGIDTNTSIAPAAAPVVAPVVAPVATATPANSSINGMGAFAAAATAAPTTNNISSSSADNNNNNNSAELQQLRSKIDALEIEKKTLQDGTERELELLRQQLKDAQSELRSANALNTSAVAAADSQTGALVNELQQQLADKTAAAAQLQQQLAAQRTELEQSNNKLAAAEKKVNELEAELLASQSIAATATAQVSTTAAEWTQKLQQREQQLQQEQAAAVAAVEERLETEKEEMMEAMAQEIEELETAKAKEFDDLSAVKNALQTKFDAVSSTKKEMTGRILKLYNANQQLSSDYKSHRQQSERDVQQMSQSLQSFMGGALLTKLSKVNETIETAVRKYRREMTERKRLHNLVQELKGNIRVFMRCRPPTPKEIEQFGNDANCVSFPDDGQVRVFNEKNREKLWEFDEVFDTDSTQQQIFEDVSALVTSVMDGYNVCIFAYGQTGSGKTFTMSGPPDNRGVNTRALEELFHRCAERSNDWIDTISVSLLEVYNEEIRDLLLDPKRAKEDLKFEVKMGEHGNYVSNLTHRAVDNIDAVMNLINTADKNRSSATTNMNEHSSRSHMILTATIESEYKPTGAKTRGKLNLVDLAGSERINKSGAAGQALKEAQNINKSLSALGDVIQARAQKQSHVPFRNSTLTFLLQDSISQDSKTLMIVCVSPVIYNSEETFCSLNFASRVRTVELGKASKQAVGSGSSGGGKSSTGPSAAATAARKR